MNRSVVIADSSALMALDNIGEIHVLPKLFSEITITPKVAREYGRQTPAEEEKGELVDTEPERTENRIMTATVELKLPDSVELSDFELKMTLAAKLYEMGTLSGGQAAEMAGLSKRTFLELLGKYGVSIFGYTADEFREELARTQ